MSKKRVAERNAGAFMGPLGMVPAPVNADNVGPGEPGPGDEWHMPDPPTDAVAGQPRKAKKPAASDPAVVSRPGRPRKG